MQISKKPLSDRIFSKMYLLLFNLFTKKRNQKEFINIFNELFSIKEQIMIIKRIALMYLLTKNITVLEVSRILKVSPCTVSKFSILAKKSDYLINFFKRADRREKILNLLEDIYLILISPPTKYGTDWETGWKVELERQRRRYEKI
jgi:hypothetical protein